MKASPMLMITGQKPIKQSKQALFQIVDVVEMMRPVTKYTQRLVHGSSIPSRVRDAFRRAQQERPAQCIWSCPRTSRAKTVPIRSSFRSKGAAAGGRCQSGRARCAHDRTG